MRLQILIILTILTLYSCHYKYEYKICDFNTSDQQLKIYNGILNELIEHRFLNRFLGKDIEQLEMEYASDNPDITKISRKTIQLQNQLFGDTARFCIIFLDTIFKPYYPSWTYLQKDTGQFALKFKKLISSFSSNGQAVMDSLNSMQDRYLPDDFHLCTAKILSLREIKNQEGECGIGVVSFSKLFLNQSKTKGLLYYSFYCGDLCGNGGLLVIEKIKDRWMITPGGYTWRS